MPISDEKNILEDDLDLDIEKGGSSGEEKKPEKEENPSEEEECSDEKYNFLVSSLLRIRQELDIILNYLEVDSSSSSASSPAVNLAQPQQKGKETIVEGVFTGEVMVGPNGKRYTVPLNYASKSKLVEGDILKLTIKPDGTFLYKQIGPVPRDRLVGKLTQDKASGQFYVSDGQRKWKILKTAVTFFGGQEGDEVIFLVPRNASSQWAAVENIITNN